MTEPQPLWDQYLITGSPAVFGQLYTLTYPNVRNYIRRNASSQHVEDLVQDVFFKLLSHYGPEKPHPAPFKALLMAVSRNTLIDHQRSQAVRNKYRGNGQDPYSLPEQRTNLDLERALGQAGSVRLSRDQQPAFSLLLNGHSNEEIANALGKSSPDTKQMVYRIREKLRSKLDFDQFL